MGYMPFQSTTINYQKSIAQIKELLYKVGFTSILEASQANGRVVLIAEASNNGQKASFQFDVNIDTVMDSLNTYPLEKRKQRATNIAWRIAHAQVKGLHDAVVWGIQSIPEAFGGNFLLPDESGNPIKVANLIVEASKHNQLSSQIFTGRLLPKPTEGE